MKRTPMNKVPIGRTEFRYRVVIESDPCMAGTFNSFFLQSEILRSLGTDPMLGMCGPVPWQTMKMRHDGAHWVVELEAVVTEG
jgi:hypothetical protein